MIFVHESCLQEFEFIKIMGIQTPIKHIHLKILHTKSRATLAYHDVTHIFVIGIENVKKGFAYIRRKVLPIVLPIINIELWLCYVRHYY